MINIDSYLEQLLLLMDSHFGPRLLYVGLQGSYSREEATQTSDIDVVVILDELSAQDIQTYGTMLDRLPHRELICGFLSGKKELLCWDAADLFQFYHDTKPIHGSLNALLTRIDDEAVKRAIKIGACNIYHGCVHNLLHEKSEQILKGLYKAASFVVQAICFQQTGNYIRRQKDLFPMVSQNEREIIENFLALKNGDTMDFEEMSRTLFQFLQLFL